MKTFPLSDQEPPSPAAMSAEEALSTTMIYEVTDCDWVAARSPEEARKFYVELTGDAEVIHEGGPEELTAAQMERLLFNDPEHQYLTAEVEDPRMSFRAALEIFIRAGHRPPFYFACTEY